MKSFITFSFLFGLLSIQTVYGTTTLIIYKSPQECTYFLMENDRAVLRWSGVCDASLEDALIINIREKSPLAYAIRKIQATQNLNAIRVLQLVDKKSIDQLEGQKLPLISVSKRSFKKDILIIQRVSKSTNTGMPDYNSTRSNKLNTATNPLYQSNQSTGVNPLYNGNKLTTGNLSHSDKTAVEDYNSTRSNKLNTATNPLYQSNQSTGVNPLYNGNKLTTVNSSSSDKTAAQDYNSTRSNKLNTATNPLYQSNQSAGVNPLYNGNKLNTGNSSPSGKTAAQDYNSTRSNKANCLLLNVGFNTGLSKYLTNGWNIEAGYQLPVTRWLKLEGATGYTLNKFEYSPSPLLPDKYIHAINNYMQHPFWKIFDISAGPVINIGRRKFNADFYTQAAILFIHIPGELVGVPDEKGEVTEQTGIARFSGNKTSLGLQVGIRLNYLLYRRITFYVNPAFITMLQADIPYEEKNVAASIDREGNFSKEEFMSLPFDQRESKLQLVKINAGVKIYFH